MEKPLVIFLCLGIRNWIFGQILIDFFSIKVWISSIFSLKQLEEKKLKLLKKFSLIRKLAVREFEKQL